MPSHEMAMMGVTAYRQLLRTSKMRTAGAPAPEESAVALQHVSKQRTSICLSVLSFVGLLSAKHLHRVACPATHHCTVLITLFCGPQARERIMLRLATQAERVQRDPRRAFARLRDQASAYAAPHAVVLGMVQLQSMHVRDLWRQLAEHLLHCCISVTWFS
jgi:hypothetical protein